LVVALLLLYIFDTRKQNNVPRNYRSIYGSRSALHVAAFQGAPDDIIKALINAGGDPKAKDKAGKTPADYAREAQYPAVS
jgi:ankyrin repeat protein